MLEGPPAAGAVTTLCNTTMGGMHIQMQRTDTESEPHQLWALGDSDMWMQVHWWRR